MSLFHKKSLNMGPIFYKNIPKHWYVFMTKPKFSLRSLENCENGPIFQQKSLKKGTYDPSKMGGGFKARVAQPRPNQI